jgi:hypothetical protein
MKKKQSVYIYITINVFNNYLLSTDYMSGIGLGTRDSSENQIVKIWVLRVYILVRVKTKGKKIAEHYKALFPISESWSFN